MPGTTYKLTVLNVYIHVLYWELIFPYQFLLDTLTLYLTDTGEVLQ